MEEIWKDIKGYKGWYEVSNIGNVRSWKGHRGHGKRKTPKKLKLTEYNTGRLHVSLCINGKCKNTQVHRLVAEAFIPNPDNKPYVLHWDDNPHNNKVSNLRWGYDTENKLDLYRNSGSVKGGAKLTRNDIIQIRNTYDIGCFTQDEIAEAWNISSANVNRIVNYRAWVNI